MSATIAEPGIIDISRTERVPFRRLVKVELQKMFDTRAGLWLGLVTGLLIVLAMAITLLVAALNDDVAMKASTFSSIMTIPVSLLVPVLAIVVVTSEWGQRTSLVTFTLEADRRRVVLAKLVTVLLLAVATIVLAVAAGAVGNLLSGATTGDPVVWDLEPGIFTWVVVLQMLYFVMAFAFGLVFLNSPGAISVYYIVALLLPAMVYGVLYATFGWAQDLIPWVDLNYAAAPFLNGEATSGADWMRVLVTALVWVLAPLALGVRRVLKAEVK